MNSNILAAETPAFYCYFTLHLQVLNQLVTKFIIVDTHIHVHSYTGLDVEPQYFFGTNCHGTGSTGKTDDSVTWWSLDKTLTQLSSTWEYIFLIKRKKSGFVKKNVYWLQEAWLTWKRHEHRKQRNLAAFIFAVYLRTLGVVFRVAVGKVVRLWACSLLSWDAT